MPYTPALVVHVLFRDESQGYYTLEWGARLEYDDHGWLSIQDSMRATSDVPSATVIGHASNIRELKIIPPTRPAVKIMPEGWDIDLLQGKRPSAGL